MKLLRFLERRLSQPVPGGMLHKWIRSGQVRVNGGRAAPFGVLAPGDAVRLPPFALPRKLRPEGHEFSEGRGAPQGLAGVHASQVSVAPGQELELHASSPHYLVLAKPGGLACQGGSGQRDSLAARLAGRYAGQAFIPAPAHRLDKGTSGLVLAGLSHAAQRRLHELLQGGALIKDYLAWVWGAAPFSGPCLLEDHLERPRGGKGRERTLVLPGGRVKAAKGGPRLAAEGSGPGHERGLALALALPLQTLEIKELPAPLQSQARQGQAGAATLLLLRLLTGRRHQIRAQLASRGLPVIGDTLYGGPDYASLLLHAHALLLPEDIFAAGSPLGQEYILPPPWRPPLAPDADMLSSARRALSEAAARHKP